MKGTWPGRRRGRAIPWMAVLAMVVAMLAALPAAAQRGGSLAEQLADKRVEQEELEFFRRSGQISAEEHRQHGQRIAAELRALQGLLAKRPRPEQTTIQQESQRLFEVRIVPLREQWKQALVQKAQEDRARDAGLQKQLAAEADRAGKLQAARVLLRERLDRNEISRDEFARADQQAEAEILALQRQWDGHGANWGRLFSGTVARVAQAATAEGRQKARLTDSASEIGRDAHRAAELTLSMQRNEVFRAKQALAADEAQRRNAALKSELDAVQGKYGSTNPNAADFRDRVTRLVQAGAQEQRARWEREADEARRAAQAAAAAARSAAPAPAPAPAPPAVSTPAPPATALAPAAPATPAPATPPPTVKPPAPAAPRPSAQAPVRAAAPTRTEAAMRPAPRPAPAERGWSLAWLALLLLPIGGGAGYLLLWRGRSSARGRAETRYAEVPQRQVPPAGERPPLAARAPAPPVPLPGADAGSLKERMLAQQREKYQARYNEAQDELTAASMELAEFAVVLDGARVNLGALSKALRDRVQALAEARHAGFRALVLGGLTLRPLLRLFRRGGPVLKGLSVGGALYLVVQFGVVSAVGVYLVAATVCVFLERRAAMKDALAALHAGDEPLKALSLVHVYDEQSAHLVNGAPAFHAFRVSASGAQAEEATLAGGSWGGIAPGAFYLAAGTMAVYRLDVTGAAAQVAAAADHAYMQAYGGLLGEAVRSQGGFAAATLPSLAAYGRVAWRRRRAAEALPQLERLLGEVARLDRCWRDTCVGDKVFEFLIRRIDLFTVRDPATPPGVLLHGLPGNGKAFLARKIAESLGAKLEAVDAARLTSPDEVRKVWAKVSGKEPVVLFVDYAERVFPRPGSRNEGAGTREATLAWLAEWEQHEAHQSQAWVVLTAESEQDVHPAILNRLGGSRIEVAAPDAAGREQVLRQACRESQVPGALPGWLVAATGGSTIQELRKVVQETKLLSAPGAPQDAHWREALKNVRGADAEFKDESKTWDRLVLPADIKEQLQRACRILREADRYKERGVTVPNVLLFGPPGTGKTDIARTFANEGGVKFVLATTADLKAEYVGQSAHKVRAVFAKARGVAPAVLFIDEIETVAARRGAGQGDSFTQEIVTEMLQQMDGARKQDRPVFVLAATNRPQDIDEAVLSRFTSKIEIPLPDEAGRQEMLRRLIAERPADPSLDVEEVSALLARRLARKSGRDLVMLVNRAMERAVMAADSPDDVRLTREGLMAEVAPHGREVSEADLQKAWSQIVLKPEVKESLLAKIRLFNAADKAAPRGLLLYGPPGTGKTEIARRLADSTSSHFMSLTGADLKAGYVGQSGQYVRRVWEEARARGRCVMFVDECEGVFARRGSVGTDSASEELVREFLAMWDGVASEGQVWVVGATNRRDQLDEAIVSRFGASVEIGLPEAPERLEILRLELAKLERPGEVPEALGRATTGFSGRNLATLARDVATLAAERGGAITPELWDAVIKRLRDASAEFKDDTKTWERLVLPAEIKEQLQRACRIVRDAERYRERGVSVPNILLFGPPGTGKTDIARTFANEGGLPFLAAATSDLKAGYVGQSGQKVREVFERARGSAPCILFIDEIETVAAKRGSPQADSFTQEIVTEMLQQMEGARKQDRPVFVLAATNRPEDVDPAILSRFTSKIEVPLPDAEGRREMLRRLLAERTLDPALDPDETAALLAPRLAGKSGRDLVMLVNRAMERAVMAADSPDDVRLTREGLLAEVGPPAREVSGADVERAWAQIVLKPEVKESILAKIRMFNAGDKAAPRGLLLYGPPGTGKTEIARRLAESTSCHFMPLTGSDLKAGYVGQSGQSVRKVWEQARARGRCVMFVDECEGVFARRGGLNTDSASEELVREFLAMWDGVGAEGQVWVVGATNRRDQLDEAIVSRFGAAVEIGLPEAAERLAILRLELAKLEREAEIPDMVARATTGMAGRDLARVVRDVCTLAAERGGAITPDLWGVVLGRSVKAASDAGDDEARWDALVLPEATVETLKTICDTLRYAETLRKQGVEPPAGALLFGPPGTGKTQIARTLAHESGLPFLAAGTADLKAGFVGQSGQKVRELFERARGKAPCILFIDEIESAVPARGGAAADQFTNEIVTQMLQELDGVKKSERPVFVLAATNHPAQVDAAILSRFEEKIEIPNPDRAQRARMFRLFFARQPGLDFEPDAMADELAGRCGEISGRDIRSLVRRAQQHAVQRAIRAGTPDHIVLGREDLLAVLPAASHPGGPTRG
jgi:SpoVK/Ycf46/Vps4 family AAA+-type ATPase